MKFFSHYPPTFPFMLKAFPKTFPARMNPASCRCPVKKKTRQEKRKKRREEKAKKNSQDCCITVKLCSNQTNKKAAKCRTCEGLCGMFYLLTARQWPENGSTCFPEKFPGVNRLISAPQFWTDYSSYFQSEKKKQTEESWVLNNDDNDSLNFSGTCT